MAASRGAEGEGEEMSNIAALAYTAAAVVVAAVAFWYAVANEPAPVADVG